MGVEKKPTVFLIAEGKQKQYTKADKNSIEENLVYEENEIKLEINVLQQKNFGEQPFLFVTLMPNQTFICFYK